MFIKKPAQDRGRTEREARHAPGPAATNQRSRPDRACCCPAKPVVVVMMASTTARPDLVDLWFCGHHYRKNRAVLTAAGTAIWDAEPGADQR
jgi:hypothetical protein